MLKYLGLTSILVLSACASSKPATSSPVAADSNIQVQLPSDSSLENAKKVKKASPPQASAKTVEGPKHMCITDDVGDKICGYDCKRTKDDAACAKTPSEKCFIDGPDVICGKNCSKNEDGDIRCKK